MMLARLLLATQVILPWDPTPAPAPAPPRLATFEPSPRLAFSAKGGALVALSGGLGGPFVSAAVSWQTHFLDDALVLEGELGGTEGAASGQILQPGAQKPYEYSVSRTGLMAFGSAQLRRAVSPGVELQFAAGLDYTVARVSLQSGASSTSVFDRELGVHAAAGVDFGALAGTVALEARIISTRATVLGDPAPALLLTACLGYRLWF